MKIHLQSILASAQSWRNSNSGVVFEAGVFHWLGRESMLITQVGYVYDSTSYYRARYYSPDLGRFISEDPVGFDGGINFYSYVYGNPTGETDPSGKFGIVGAAVGAGVDIGIQLLTNGGRFHCISWTSVGLSAVVGAFTGGLSEGAFELKAGSNAWGATRKWLAKDLWELESGQPVHHWLIEQRSAIGKLVPNAIKNQPWNLNPVSVEWHQFLHSIDPVSRTILGAPGWAQGVGIGTGVAVGGAMKGKSCDCE